MFGSSKEKAKKPTLKPTQGFLEVAEIRDDCIVMNDGTIRSVLAVASTNFELKNQEEQDALVFNYQRFLNSLEFPIQILMQSRKMDVSSYIDTLKGMLEKQTNELLRIQTAEYIDFIDRLVESANVMNKSFYCVIPYDVSVNSKAPGFFSRIFGGGEAKIVAERLATFQKNKVFLDERSNSVASALSSVGLRSVRLNTDQLVELLYNSYNFDSGPAIAAQSLSEVALEGEKH